MAQGLKIGELAKMADCRVETIRYYEREGLLPVAIRSTGNYRLYSDKHVAQLHFIRHCRSLDMSLDCIRRLLRLKEAPEETCGTVDALLEAHIAQVAERIAQLESLESQLKQLRSSCKKAKTVKDCRILQGLSTAPA